MSAWRPLWEPRYMDEVIQFNNLQKESPVWQFENKKGLPYDNFQKTIVDLQRKRKKIVQYENLQQKNDLTRWSI